jgi:N-acetylmuramoyl-L-alanine amidase
MSFSRSLRGSFLNWFSLLLMFLAGLPCHGMAAPKTAPGQYTAEAEYQRAADDCYRLERNPALGQRREDWLTVVQDLELVCQKHPASRTAPSCLHLSGRMRRSMHQHFNQAADLKRSLALFGKVVTAFPQSPEAADSLYAIGQIEQARGNLRTAAKVYADVVQLYPFSAKKAQAEGQLRNLTAIAESLAAKKTLPEGHGPQAEPPGYPPPKIAVTPPVPTAAVSRVPVHQSSVSEKKGMSGTVQPPQPARSEIAVAVAPLKVGEFNKAGQKKTAVQADPPKPARERIALPEPNPVPPEKKAAQKTEPAEEQSAASSLLSNLNSLKKAIFGGAEQDEKPAVTATPRIVLPEAAQTKPVEKTTSLKPASPPAAASAPKIEQEKSETAPAIKTTLDPVKPVQEQIALPAPKPTAPDKPKEPESAAAKIVLSSLKIAELPKTPATTAPPVIQKEQAKKEEAQELELVSILPVQHWSSDKYSRVAVTASGPAVYHAKLPAADQPGQVTIEFKQSRIAAEARASLAVNSSLIKEIRAQQTDPATVRVVLALADDADCKVFSLSDPFRVVVDLRKSEETAAAANPPEKIATAEKNGSEAAAVKKSEPVKPENLTLAQQLGLGVRRIVIDPGHGGKDTGALGFGLQEKDIVLKVAEKVRAILKKENHYEIFLTRERDTFLPLEERAAIANTKGADLFLSIHVNAHPEQQVKGVETFYLNLATNPEAMRVAALENATSARSISDMQDILADLLKNTKINESSQFAEFIQKSMVSGLRKQYQVKDLGVKQAPFYVLIGAQMPAVLAEISFISNPKEAALLKDEQYLQAVAEQIAAGVISYIEHRRTAALVKPSSAKN